MMLRAVNSVVLRALNSVAEQVAEDNLELFIESKQCLSIAWICSIIAIVRCIIGDFRFL